MQLIQDNAFSAIGLHFFHRYKIKKKTELGHKCISWKTFVYRYTPYKKIDISLLQVIVSVSSN